VGRGGGGVGVLGEVCGGKVWMCDGLGQNQTSRPAMVTIKRSRKGILIDPFGSPKFASTPNVVYDLRVRDVHPLETKSLFSFAG
jgi:hypothetical protein